MMVATLDARNVLLTAKRRELAVWDSNKSGTTKGNPVSHVTIMKRALSTSLVINI
jgi:hypothetical protein